MDDELNYNDVRPGRRIFSPQTPQMPLGPSAQSSSPSSKGLQSLAVASVKKAAAQTLKIKMDDEAFERVYGFVLHPVPLEKGRKLVVRVVSQFGEENLQVMVL